MVLGIVRKKVWKPQDTMIFIDSLWNVIPRVEVESKGNPSSVLSLRHLDI